MDQEPYIRFWGSYQDHSPKDSFFENLIAISYASSMEDVFPLYDPEDYIDEVNSHFVGFLKGCQFNFKSRNDNPIDTYNYFKYIFNRFQVLKGAIFSERDGKIIHKGLTNPLSIESEGHHKSAYYLYEHVNQAMSILEDYVKQLTPPKAPSNDENPPPPPPKIRGFRIKNKDCLDTAFNRLRSLYIVHTDVRQKDFEDAFSGWVPINKITWLDGPGLLSYFIKSINGKGIEDEKKNIWITTINCFQDKDLNAFTIEQLRFAKKPTKTDF